MLWCSIIIWKPPVLCVYTQPRFCFVSWELTRGRRCPSRFHVSVGPGWGVFAFSRGAVNVSTKLRCRQTVAVHQIYSSFALHRCLALQGCNFPLRSAHIRMRRHISTRLTKKQGYIPRKARHVCSVSTVRNLGRFARSERVALFITSELATVQGRRGRLLQCAHIV